MAEAVFKGMSSMPKQAVKAAMPREVERAAVRELVRAARARGEELTGPDGLLKSITETVPEAALELEEKWCKPYPTIPKLWARGVGGVHPVPRLRRDPASSLLYQRNREPERQIPQGGRGEGHFPTEQAALKCLYLVTRGLDPKGLRPARRITRWKPALNAFAVTFAHRMSAAENL